FLVLAMVAAMIPMMAVSAVDVVEQTTTPADTWTSNSEYYDLSWCKTLESADSTKTVTVDGVNYHVKGDWTNQKYHFTTAAQLAGLAYLSNLTSGDLFKGDIFYIDADIDLGAHKWDPISKKSKFRGSIIGNVDGDSATIYNMIIDTSEESNVSVGLVGQFGGDWIENLDLKYAKITAHSFTVGSFVGWQNGNVGSGLVNGVRAGGYRNLSSDAEIVVTSYRDDRFDDIGGIVGIINGTNTDNGTPAPVITGCVFTGTISAPYGDDVGGILGLEQSDLNGVKISDCVVVSEKLEWGKSNYYITANQEWNTGFGGIAGNIYSNKTTDAVAFSVTNCYVAANLITLECDVAGKSVQNVGGIVGAACSQAKTIENCQFDGIVLGNAGQIGGVLGRYYSPVTIKNTVVTGVAMRSAGNVSAYVGRSNDAGLSIDNCFNSIKMLTGNGGAAMSPITATTDLSSLLSLTDGSEAKIWTKGESDLYPVLAVAVPYISASLSVSASGADFSWCDMSGSMKIRSEAQLKALDTMGLTTFKGVFDAAISFAPSFAAADLGTYSPYVSGLVKTALGISDVTDTAQSVLNMGKSFAQVSLEANSNGLYDVRFVLPVYGTDYSGVTVDVGASRVEDGVVKYGGFVTSDAVTECYRSVLEVKDAGDPSKNVTHTAAEEVGEGWYYVVFVVNNVDLAYATTFTVRATATGADSTQTQSIAVNYTISD
ncbi:MAG: hypothetical protein ACI3XQ_10520, partial [Eubacteriales bacterium]